jgi:hypothetical protein
MTRTNVMPILSGVLLVAATAVVAQDSKDADPAQLMGVWRGTSICTDRVAAPACTDETVVYEFTAGQKPGTVHWTADKVVNGQREPMGEFDLQYDAAERVWKARFSSPRVTSEWRVSVEGRHLTGSARLLPGNETIRRIDARKQ